MERHCMAWKASLELYLSDYLVNVIIPGSVGLKLATRMGMKPESMMSAKQSGTATVGSA